jgi:hypothetical protein
MDQVFDILETQDHLGDAPDAVVVMELKGAVEFEDVHFAYGEARGSPLINGIHRHVKPGEHVAVVGARGAQQADEGTHRLRHCPPAEHGGGLGLHPGAEGRPHHQGGAA